MWVSVVRCMDISVFLDTEGVNFARKKHSYSIYNLNNILEVIFAQNN